MSLATLLWLVLLGAVVWKGWGLLAPKRGGKVVFEVSVRGSGEDAVRLRGRVPHKLPADVRRYIAGLGLPRGASVRAMARPRGFVLRFAGGIEAEAQRKLGRYFHVDD